ncbi:ABC transporter ATP-binding protein [Paenibacillus beijingensis]|uniref:ABC transporter ATP-binding protein n=1 Tax=Paenibacillus beijingensis TaxID=1126833 RepID=UPI0006970BC0|nr:energy-coupling factor transporter ATPase [Paenibacillus beijingensis]
MPISVQNVSYRHLHGSSRALEAVNLEIGAGEIAALVGKSGSGKSTLGFIISGVIPGLIKGSELSGDIIYDDERQHGVGFVSQIPENQLFGYRVEDAIVFGLENMGLGQAEIGARLERVLKLFRIEKLRDSPVSALSGGQKQTVCIASVLAMAPKLIILDEPVSSLDPQGKALVQEVLLQLKSEGQTVLLIDQNLDWSAQAVDRVIGLEAGRIVFDGAKMTFFRDANLYRRLGVTVPQMVDLFHECSPDPGTAPFTTVEDAAEFFRDKLADGWKDELREDSVSPDASSEPTIELKDVVKEFDGFRALDGVNARFDPGKVTAVLGQNGSGKTTMVRHLINLHRPTFGSVLYRGQSLQQRSTADIARSVAYVFQHPDQMIFEDSVHKEVTFSSRMMQFPIAEERVEELLAAHGLLAYKDSFPMNLSMGHKHMLTILSVLLTDPDVIILDEPTLGMDRIMKDLLARLIEDLKANDKTVIMISHEMSFVAETADETILMKNGRILLQGTTRDVFGRSELLRSVCIEPPQIKELADRLSVPGILTVPQFMSACRASRSAINRGGVFNEV